MLEDYGLLGVKNRVFDFLLGIYDSSNSHIFRSSFSTISRLLAFKKVQ